MKNKIIIMFFYMFLLCGCNANLKQNTIEEDKSMGMELFIALEDAEIDRILNIQENLESTNISIDAELNVDIEIEYTKEAKMEFVRNAFGIDLSDLEEKKFIVKEYEEDGYKGYIISKTIDDVDTLVGIPDFNINSIDEIDTAKIFTKEDNIYKGKIVIDNQQENIENNDQPQSKESIKYSLKLSLPYSTNSNNATTVTDDGKQLTWNLALGTISTIEFDIVFPKPPTFFEENMHLIVAISVALILLIIIIIIISSNSKKKKDNITNIIKNNDTSISKSNINTIDPTQINQILNHSESQSIQQSIPKQTEQQNLNVLGQLENQQPIMNMQQNIQRQQGIITQVPIVMPNQQNKITPALDSQLQMPVIQPIMPNQTKQKQETNKNQQPLIKPQTMPFVNANESAQNNIVPQPVKIININNQ